MEGLLSAYEKACEELQVEPLPILVNGLKNAIEYNSVVAAIKLTGNSKVLFNDKLDSRQATAIATALHGDENVHTLDFSYNKIDDEGMEALAGLVGKNANIASLILSNNCISDKGLKTLVHALENGSGSGLQQLVLSCNPQVTDESILALSGYLRSNQTLAMIDLGYTGMGMKGMMGIYSALMESPAAEVIESLKLDAPTFNGPSEHATRHLAQAIKSCRNLKELSLRAFHLDDIELSYLVKNAFAPKMGLVSLSLRSNRLTDMCGPSLGEMVRALEELEELDLAGNELGDVAAVELGQAMIDMGDQCRVWNLDLRTNKINDLGLEAVAETLAQCPSLQYVRLWGNRFGRASSETMAEVLEQLAEEGRDMDIDVKPYCVDGAWMVAEL